MDDATLADQIKQGHQEAKERFVRTHYESLMRFALCLTRNQMDAEDLTQQAILRGIQRIDRYGGQSSLKTWLHAILFREFTKWRRSFRRLATLRRDQAAGTCPFDQLREAQVLLDALDSLDPIHRATFVLHEVQGFDVVEVASALNIPEGTVKSRLHHARNRLRTKLEIQTEEPNGNPLLQTR
jgi:RNA polymerase sigma-70 factor (ECF subfamily)